MNIDILRNSLTTRILWNCAEANGFYKRFGKITPQVFIDLLLHCALHQAGYCSLSQMSNYLSWQLNIDVSKQAIDERFTDSAYKYVLSVVNYIAGQRMSSTLDTSFLEAFSRVRIKDSTKFKLPCWLKDQYKGHGGFGDIQSGMCIQFEYDLKSNAIIGFSLTNETRNDFEESREESQPILSNDLLIRDLGYWSINKFKQIKSAGAFFLSRLNTTVELFDLQGNRFELKTVYQKMKKYRLTHQQFIVRLGIKEQIVVRLCVSLASDEVYEKRITTLKKQNQRYKNATIRQETKDRYHLNLFVTNIPCQILDTPDILKAYHFRWQIELIFKQWKSIAGVASVTAVRAERFLCILYAKLILILINYRFMRVIQSFYYRTNQRLLSPYKCMQSLWLHFDIISDILKRKSWRNTTYIDSLITRFSRNHYLENRKKHITFEDLFYYYLK